MCIAMTKPKFYPDVESNLDFPKLEETILKYWKDNDVFKRSVDSISLGLDSMASDDSLDPRRPEPEKKKEFVFYDGPPFANGLPHYGHLLTGFVKDTYARYQTTKGKRVERRFGWDCHGLPAEMGAEKELGFSGRIAITEYGIGKFNDKCRESVMKYASEWEKYVTRQARWVDFENSYKTMDKSFMESVIWAFKQLYEKGLVYESMRVMPYSWACETPLSNFETRLDNAYRERADKAVTMSFKLKDKPSFAPDGYKEYRLVAWTTMPWTFVPNLAVAVNPEMEYIAVGAGDVCYIGNKSIVSLGLDKATSLGLDKASSLGLDPGVSGDMTSLPPETLRLSPRETCTGKDLLGLTYEPLFPYFKDHPNAFRVIPGDFVVEGQGTGIVSIAPGFGEDDQIVCEAAGIKLVCPVDNAGRFTSEVTDFAGMQVFDANDPIIMALKKQGAWIKTEQYLHNYPHCWRTDTPLIYKAVPSWYIKVTAFKDRMVELNQQINWIPGHIKDGLFGKWLEGARDWSISRNRFWGTPIPIWQSNDPMYPRIDVYGSIEELERDFGVKVPDLHRPYIDELTRPNPNDPTGKSMMMRCTDVFDCWFESGSMPYGQAHYPFENKDWFESHFPADFIVEYTAQTRGWFYTLMVLSTALFDRPPFLNCICHGVVLDSAGQKLSKRLNNYADPLELFDKYGADALRLTMLSSGIVKGQELLIDKEGKMVFESLRLHIKPIWNAYNFFTLYANADGIRAQLSSLDSIRGSRESFEALESWASPRPRETNVLDSYILSKLAIAIQKIEQSLDAFDSQAAYAEISAFFEVLNNWYIRRSRNRFWKTEKDADKKAAYDTLYTCLELMSRAMSSLLPIVSEAIYLGLQGLSLGLDPRVSGVDSHQTLGSSPREVLSVHLAPFPDVSAIKVDRSLVSTMDKVLEICNAGLFIRSTENIRVRQPLQDLKLVMKDSSAIRQFEDLIMDELNVKSVIYLEDVESYADLKLLINFPILGKRLPSKIKDIISASKQGKWSAAPLGQDAFFSSGKRSDGPGISGNRTPEVLGLNTMETNSPECGINIANETLLPEEFTLNLVPKTTKGSKALSSNDGVVMLNLEIDRNLELEGLARDIIRAVQQARKEADFHISDRIMLEIDAGGDALEALKVHSAMIEEQTLSEYSHINLLLLSSRLTRESFDDPQDPWISDGVTSQVGNSGPNHSYETEAEVGNSKIILKLTKK